MNRFTYTGNKTKEIAFPLGGIGSGCVSLNGNGNLVDWEIFNAPNKNSRHGFSHFAIKAESDGEVLDSRVLHGDLLAPYSGETNAKFLGIGFGPPREYLMGLPHFRKSTFIGEFPYATILFEDPSFPGKVKLTAFNPFIPLNEDDSSIPGAFFEIEVENTTNKEIIYSIAFTTKNPFGVKESVNIYEQKDAIHSLNLKSNVQTEEGGMSIATDAKEVSYQEYWYRGAWFDNLAVYWQDFVKNGPLKNRKAEGTIAPTPLQTSDHGTLSAKVNCAPKKATSVKYVVTWNFPTCSKSWQQQEETICCGNEKSTETWKNYYATLFKDSQDSAQYSLKNWDRLHQETLKFKNTLFSSSLPDVVLEAISANLSTLKTPTCLRLEDGSFYAFEGCHSNEGCCEGSCTHVWNYVYILPFLFPALARSMRDLEYEYNLNEVGDITFRLMLPLGSPRSSFKACVDGQYGTILNTYREWKISGDSKWLKKKWPCVKIALEYAWSPENPNLWDPDKTGIIHGSQHHTLDMDLFGPNSWLSGFYLAALKACSIMAIAMDEPLKAEEYLSLFNKGKQWVDENLFNGEYYHQQLDLKNKSILEPYKDDSALMGGNTEEAYWSAEHEEIKYQVGDGCLIDQVLAQWHANLIGLGEIYDNRKTKKSLQSVYKNNFKTSMRDHFNPCRIFALNDEAGEVICEWPQGVKKPTIAVPYAEETMHGFEYASASHMIQEGMIEEGLNIIKAVRDKYDGEKRNPWNEIECGNHYARSMATYAFLLDWSGFQFDMVNHELGFNPLQYDKKGAFQSFWSISSGWGEIQIKPDSMELTVLYGNLQIKKLQLPFLKGKAVSQIMLGASSLDSSQLENTIELESLLEIPKGTALRILFWPHR